MPGCQAGASSDGRISSRLRNSPDSRQEKQKANIKQVRDRAVRRNHGRIWGEGAEDLARGYSQPVRQTGTICITAREDQRRPQWVAGLQNQQYPVRAGGHMYSSTADARVPVRQ